MTKDHSLVILTWQWILFPNKKEKIKRYIQLDRDTPQKVNILGISRPFRSWKMCHLTFFWNLSWVVVWLLIEEDKGVGDTDLTLLSSDHWQGCIHSTFLPEIKKIIFLFSFPISIFLYYFYTTKLFSFSVNTEREDCYYWKSI